MEDVEKINRTEPTIDVVGHIKAADAGSGFFSLKSIFGAPTSASSLASPPPMNPMGPRRASRLGFFSKEFSSAASELTDLNSQVDKHLERIAAACSTGDFTTFALEVAEFVRLHARDPRARQLFIRDFLDRANLQILQTEGMRHRLVGNPKVFGETVSNLAQNAVIFTKYFDRTRDSSAQPIREMVPAA